ncbi:MAG TPA: hypothetical protein VK961_08740 [Chthoniobacter sp.]|nr:hypothetical protein [Chthoniobacter sp.]
MRVAIYTHGETNDAWPCAAANCFTFLTMFRLSAQSLFLCISSLALPLFLIGVWLIPGLQADWGVVLVAMVGIVFFSGIGAGLLHLLFPVRISPDGIAAHSVWGFRRFIRCEQIGAVRQFSLLNLHFLRLYSTVDRKVTWLALFPSDPVSFRDAIASTMPPDSPLMAYFRVA